MTVGDTAPSTTARGLPAAGFAQATSVLLVIAGAESPLFPYEAYVRLQKPVAASVSNLGVGGEFGKARGFSGV